MVINYSLFIVSDVIVEQSLMIKGSCQTS